MTLKAYIHRTSVHATLLLTFLICSLLNPAPALALGNRESAIPDFAEFSRTVRNNDATVLRGVYVPDVLALPIVPQPAGNPGYVSIQDEEVTQFGMAAQFGNVGLLAHNYLSGRLFSRLAPGGEVRLVYGDGTVEYFVITEVLEFQALQPNSLYSSFRNLRNDEMLSAEQVFNRVYRGERHVTFQTCIAGAESMSWGRLFVIAAPKPQAAGIDRLGSRAGR